jgi:DNA polymerase-3 subunit epsilon
MRVPGFRRRPASEAARAYVAAPRPRLAAPWRLGRYCVVDVETTGLDADAHEIISFAAIPIDEGRIVAAGAVEGLIRPRRSLPEESIRIHGIVPSDLADAPPIEAAIEELLHAMAGRVLVAHSAWVERGFLGVALRRRGVRLGPATIDTCVLGALLLHERHGSIPRRDVGLTYLAEELGLPVHRQHNATGDALTTAQVFLSCATHLDAIRPETVGSLASAERRVANIRRFQSASA